VFAADLQPAIAAFNDYHFVQAKPLFEAAVNDSARKNEALYYLGRIAFEEGDAEKAKDYLNQSVDIEPNTSDEYYWLGRAYGELALKASIFKQASYASSVHKYFQLAVDADPKNVPAKRGLFEFYIMAPSIMGGSTEKAEQLISDMHALSPVDADIKKLVLLAKKDEQDKRLAQAKFLVTQYPNSAEALYNAGGVLREKKNYVDALAALEAAAKIPVTHQNKQFVESSLFLFSDVSLTTGTKTEEAISGLEKLLARNSENPKANKNWPLWNLAKLYSKQGNLEKYQSLRNQIDQSYVKTDKVLKEEMEKFGKK
jgi:tetratricopeptide (TPR) repeat protein